MYVNIIDDDRTEDGLMITLLITVHTTANQIPPKKSVVAIHARRNPQSSHRHRYGRNRESRNHASWTEQNFSPALPPSPPLPPSAKLNFRQSCYMQPRSYYTVKYESTPVSLSHQIVGVWNGSELKFDTCLTWTVRSRVELQLWIQ